MSFSRREALAGLGAAATATGMGWLRLADIRPYDQKQSVSADHPPKERILTAENRLHAVDHRTDVAVEVRRDGSGETPYRAEHHRFFRQPSRRRHWFQYTTSRHPAGNPGPTLGTGQAFWHYAMANSPSNLPDATAFYISDAFVAVDRDVPVPSDPDERPQLTDTAKASSYDSYDELGYIGAIPAHVHDHRAEWTRTARDAETVTFRLTAPDGYAQVPPLPLADSVDEGSRISITLDRETGLLRRIVDERVLTRRTNPHDEPTEKRQYEYRIETQFSQYGEATAPAPDTAPRIPITARVRGTVRDLLRY